MTRQELGRRPHVEHVTMLADDDRAVDERRRVPGEHVIGVEDADGHRRAGALRDEPAQPGSFSQS